jgi:hypothetical protein
VLTAATGKLDVPYTTYSKIIIGQKRILFCLAAYMQYHETDFNNNNNNNNKYEGTRKEQVVA